MLHFACASALCSSCWSSTNIPQAGGKNGGSRRRRNVFCYNLCFEVILVITQTDETCAEAYSAVPHNPQRYLWVILGNVWFVNYEAIAESSYQTWVKWTSAFAMRALMWKSTSGHIIQSTPTPNFLFICPTWYSSSSKLPQMSTNSPDPASFNLFTVRFSLSFICENARPQINNAANDSLLSVHTNKYKEREDGGVDSKSTP